MEVELVERMADAFFLNAKVTNGGKTAVTFDFACKMAQTRMIYHGGTESTEKTNL